MKVERWKNENTNYFFDFLRFPEMLFSILLLIHNHEGNCNFFPIYFFYIFSLKLKYIRCTCRKNLNESKKNLNESKESD